MPDPEEISESRLSSEQAASIGAVAALRPYVAALRGHWRLIALVALLALAACAGWFARKDPVYEASAKVLVSPLPEDSPAFLGLPIIRSSDDPSRLIGTAAGIIESPEAAEEAAAGLAGLDRGAVESAISVEAEEGSNIVTITAESTDPEEAATLANAYANGALAARGTILKPLLEKAIADLRTQIAELENQGSFSADQLRPRLAEMQVAADRGRDPTLAIAQEAIVPGSARGLSRRFVLVMALVGGFAIGSMAAVLIDLLTPRRIDDEADLRAVYPLPILARVPDAGSGSSLSQSVTQIRESHRTLRGRLTYSQGGAVDRTGLGTVAIVSPSRGDGRTSSVLNLSRAIVAGGNEVVALELDLRHPSLAWTAGHVSERDLAETLLADAPLSTALEEISPGLSLIAAPQDAPAEMIESATGMVPALVAAALEVADSVVIDTPAFDEASDAIAAISAVEHVVIVVRMGQTSAGGIARLREALEVLGVQPAGYALIGKPISAAEAPRGVVTG